MKECINCGSFAFYSETGDFTSPVYLVFNDVTSSAYAGADSSPYWEQITDRIFKVAEFSAE